MEFLPEFAEFKGVDFKNFTPPDNYKVKETRPSKKKGLLDVLCVLDKGRYTKYLLNNLPDVAHKQKGKELVFAFEGTFKIYAGHKDIKGSTFTMQGHKFLYYKEGSAHRITHFNSGVIATAVQDSLEESLTYLERGLINSANAGTSMDKLVFDFLHNNIYKYNFDICTIL